MPPFSKNMKARHESESDEDEWEDESHAADSDAELQDAFARGHLKPGLNATHEQRPQPANNMEKLIQKLEEIKQKLPWPERLDLTNKLAALGPEIAAEMGIDPNVTLRNQKSGKKFKKEKAGDSDEDGEEMDNVDDDFKRELRFYRQAQGAVLEAFPRLEALGIPTKRPEDYFAEMAKSDEQMKKIREKLISKQQQMELSEKAKKLRDQRKYGKQVQQEVLKKRLVEKKKFTESVKKFRKGAKNQQDELEFMTELEGTSKQRGKNQRGPSTGGNKSVQQKGAPKKSGRQDYKDSKYGFGGQKKRSKYNTKDSADDVTNTFHRRQHGSGPKKMGSKRPGKMSRQKLQNRNKR